MKTLSPGNGTRMNQRHFVGIFLLSLATLLLELALMRVLSIALWYHFGFLIISTALLGFGTSGIVLALWTGLRVRADLDRALAALCLLFGVTTIASFWMIHYIPFDPFSKFADTPQLLYMPIYYLTLAQPFFCSGLAIALLFTRGSGLINRLYAADLLGAGAGCAAIAGVMPAFGDSGSVVSAATFGFVAAAIFGFRRARWLALAGSTLATLGLVLAFFATQALPIAVTPSKEHPLQPPPPRPRPIYTAWNTFSRIDMYELSAMPEKGWPGRGFGIVIDGGTAATGMGDLSAGVHAYLANAKDFRPPGIAYIGKKNPKVLIIGSGAGPEVLEALYYKASSITAVEINPIINDIVSRRMRHVWGGLFEQPEVRLATEDGRSFVRRSAEKYDAIISVQTISNSAITSGALSLAEDYLFTLEAFEDYLDHLTPDGILFVTRPINQLARLFATAREVFERRNLGSPANHLVAFVLPPLPWGSRLSHSGMLFKKSPLTLEELQELSERLGVRHSISGPDQADPQKFHYSPLYRRPGSIFHSLMMAPDVRPIYSTYPAKVNPATDDQPFFNHQTRWSNLTLDALWSRKVEGILLMLLLQSLVAASILILLPLVRFSRQGLRGPGSWAFLVYFAGLGLGFIMIEIALLQRFSLFLGQPVYTFAVVLASLLVFTGVGSWISDRLDVNTPRRLPWILLSVPAVIALTALAIPPVFSATLGLDLPGRVAIAVALIAPIGIILGVPFPMGLRIAATEAAAFVPWAWGINGFFTVIGSVGAMILGMSFGFNAVVMLAAGCYLAAISAIAVRNRLLPRSTAGQ